MTRNSSVYLINYIIHRFSNLRFNINHVVSILAIVMLCGCGSIILPQDNAHLVRLNAKERVVLTNPSKPVSVSQTQTGAGEGSDSASDQVVKLETVALRFCAEPSPDVFTALAASLGAETSASKSSSLDTTFAAKLAATFSENAATIERTQTVNILREVMYRNCERYLSGAISEEEFIVQAARDQQLIVQVLSVEQITGVARAQSTALLNISKAADSGVTDTGLETLANAKKERDAKRGASEKITSEALALPPTGTCGQNPIDIENLPSGVTADQAMAKNAKCDEAKKAASLVKEADDYLSVVQHAVARQADVSSETQGKVASAMQIASEASEEIAKVVLDIVRQYQAFDEIGMTCVVHMRSGKPLPIYCEKLLEQMALTRQAQLGVIAEGLDPQKVQDFKQKIEEKTSSSAKTVWNYLKPSFTEDNLKALASKAGLTLNTVHVKRLVKANFSLPEFTEAFANLPIDQQEQLVKATQQP